MKINICDYMVIKENFEGFCVECDAFTTSQVEPDAANRKCSVCDKTSVVGAELAVMLGFIELEEKCS